MSKTQSVWPVNEKGEIVSDIGTGTRNIVGYLQQDQIPVSSIGALSIAPPVRKGWEIVAKSGASATVTGTTSETAAATIMIPAGLLKENSVIKVTAFMRVQTAGDTSNKSYTVRYGGAAGFGNSAQIYAAGTTAVGVIALKAHIFCRNSLSSQLGGIRNSYTGIGNTSSAADLVATTYDTTQDTYLYLCLDPGNASDVMVLESYCVEVTV